ncbi:MAG TPA: hypothetical protein PL033_04755 [Candidatus Brocadiia bacterium]|nr:hypothetical protein [Candidatus Brocadiia bacterium]
MAEEKEGALKRAGELVKEKAAIVQEKAKEAGAEVKQYVGENPAKSLLLAACVGFLLGMLVARRE